MTAGVEEDGDEEISQGIVIFRLEVLIDTDDSVPVLIGEDNVIAIVEDMQLKLSKVSYIYHHPYFHFRLSSLDGLLNFRKFDFYSHFCENVGEKETKLDILPKILN